MPEGTWQADRAGKDAWLISSGPHNVPFYKFHGYESVGQIRMGKNDLLWFKGEIVCDVVSILVFHKYLKCILKYGTDVDGPKVTESVPKSVLRLGVDKI